MSSQLTAYSRRKRTERCFNQISASTATIFREYPDIKAENGWVCARPRFQDGLGWKLVIRRRRLEATIQIRMQFLGERADDEAASGAESDDSVQ